MSARSCAMSCRKISWNSDWFRNWSDVFPWSFPWTDSTRMHWSAFWRSRRIPFWSSTPNSSRWTASSWPSRKTRSGKWPMKRSRATRVPAASAPSWRRRSWIRCIWFLRMRQFRNASLRKTQSRARVSRSCSAAKRGLRRSLFQERRIRRISNLLKGEKNPWKIILSWSCRQSRFAARRSFPAWSFILISAGRSPCAPLRRRCSGTRSFFWLRRKI